MQKLMWATQALAQPAEVQVGLFPDFAAPADELALEFDEFYQPFIASDEAGLLLPGQRAALDELDTLLTELSGPDGPWTREALESADAWVRIRALAARVLAVLNWPNEAPPQDRGAIYVGPPSQA